MWVHCNLNFLSRFCLLAITNLPKISFSSCSETNWPRFATKSVEHGGLFTPIPGCEDEDPTGDAKAGLGKKCGNDAACTEVRAVGCGKDIGGCKKSQNIKMWNVN